MVARLLALRSPRVEVQDLDLGLGQERRHDKNVIDLLRRPGPTGDDAVSVSLPFA